MPRAPPPAAAVAPPDPARRGRHRPWRITAILCIAELLSMSGFATYPALLAQLRDLWGLSGAAAGFVGGSLFAGYMAAVPFLSGLTDRVDGRGVYAFAGGLAAAGAIAFAVLAQGVWSAALCQAVVGAGLAGTYMPGLKLLTERIEGPRQSRHIAFYTSTFGFGTSASLLLASQVEALAGWRWAFVVAGAGPLAAGLLVLWTLTAVPAAGGAAPPRLFEFRPVLQNREALRYIAGYAAHCWELFGLRSWIVAFLVFSFSPAESAPAAAAAVAAAINLLGAPASILGNELALRQRRRLIAVCMLLAAASACLVGFSAPLPAWAVTAALAIYFVFIMGDSASLTAGLIAATPPAQRGTTLALHSLLGFGAGFVAPLVFGATLDAAGGPQRVLAWGIAFATLAGGYAAYLALLIAG